MNLKTRSWLWSRRKAHEGKIEDVESVGGEEERKTADVIDLTELLKRSLGGKAAAKPKAKAEKPAKAAPAKEDQEGFLIVTWLILRSSSRASSLPQGSESRRNSHSQFHCRSELARDGVSSG
jgi:hypothetical protein